MISRLPVYKVPYSKDITLGNMYILLTYNAQVYTYYKGNYRVVLIEWYINGKVLTLEKYLDSIPDMRYFIKYCNKLIEYEIVRNRLNKGGSYYAMREEEY